MDSAAEVAQVFFAELALKLWNEAVSCTQNRSISAALNVNGMNLLRVTGSMRSAVRQLACDILQKCSTEQDRDEPYLTTLVGFFSRVGHMHSGNCVSVHALIA